MQQTDWKKSCVILSLRGNTQIANMEVSKPIFPLKKIVDDL